ncbi:hypothetical protein ACTFWZ_16750 [Enterococcus gallinarum]
MTLIQLADTLHLNVSEIGSPHDIIEQQKTLSNFWKVPGNRI